MEDHPFPLVAFFIAQNIGEIQIAQLLKLKQSFYEKKTLLIPIITILAKITILTMPRVRFPDLLLC